ncbi:MAG: hypothetical protein B6D55_05265 [Candidatus Omnitrophica bacterium 4484_70.2]|nr:MAG: hypothetical protein B6D55_05265 [Candidatus Omnitrophica bacterium 4484_70.2]
MKVKNKIPSIIYVNYSPYGNAGYILDYLKEFAENLIYVSFIFHPVERESKAQIYHHGKLNKQIKLPTILVPEKYVYYFAPILSFIAALELIAINIYVICRFRIKPQLFLAPNAFLVVIGIILRALKMVKRVTFWVWDYYPVPKTGFYRKIFYKAYWVLDRWCTYKADFIWYLNKRLKEVRENLGVTDDGQKEYIVPLGMKPFVGHRWRSVGKNTLGFIGVLKKNQGLELLLNSLPELVSIIPDIKIEIIGSGPDEKYFRKMAERSSEGNRVTFYGFIDFVEEEERAGRIVVSWMAAVALYIPVKENLSAYADPSKVKFYLSCGVPVIITRVPLIAEEIHRRGAGIAIGYNTQELVSAVRGIFVEKDKYREKAICFTYENDYRKIYDSAFNVTRERLCLNKSIY